MEHNTVYLLPLLHTHVNSQGVLYVLIACYMSHVNLLMWSMAPAQNLG